MKGKGLLYRQSSCSSSDSSCSGDGVGSSTSKQHAHETANLMRFRFLIHRKTLTQLTFAVDRRYRCVLAGTVTQGDVEQTDSLSTVGNSLPVVIRPADVHQSTDRLMDIKRRRQSVLVTV